MPGIYIIKLRYYLPYLTFFSATLTRANEEYLGISFWVPTSECTFFGPGGFEFCFDFDFE